MSFKSLCYVGYHVHLSDLLGDWGGMNEAKIFLWNDVRNILTACAHEMYFPRIPKMLFTKNVDGIRLHSFLLG